MLGVGTDCKLRGGGFTPQPLRRRSCLIVNTPMAESANICSGLMASIAFGAIGNESIDNTIHMQAVGDNIPLGIDNRRAGYMFQSDALMPWRNALSNVPLPPLSRR